MFAAALALAAAVSWGVGDFLGGVKSRTLRPIAVLIVAQPIGCALLGIWVAARGEAPPGTGVFWAALLIGTFDFVLKKYLPQGGPLFIYALTILFLLWRPQGLFGAGRA